MSSGSDVVLSSHRTGAVRVLAAPLLAFAVLVGSAPAVSADDLVPAPSAPAEPSPSAPTTPEPTPSAQPTPAPSVAPSLAPTAPPAVDPVLAAYPPPAPSEPAVAAVPLPFDLNLYRSRAFVRQYTRSWCVAAATMTMANTMRLLRSATGWLDRTYVRQRRIISYAKAQDTLRRSDGSDPRGWAAALRRFGGGATYRERAFSSYEAAIRFAAERIRQTGRPVGLLARHGGHAWVLHGFTATADPAVSDEFVVTSAWVTGPLAGRDPRNRELTADALRSGWGRYLQRDGYRGWYKKWLLVAP